MGQINKQQYECRRESAARRMAENAEVTTLTSEQHELLAEIASARHAMHTKAKEMYNCESAGYSSLWSVWFDGSRSINERLEKESMPTISYSMSECDFPTSDDRQLGLINDTDEAEEENIEKFYELHGKLNNDIERYLRQIDERYGTKYAPSGKLRVM